MILLLDCMKLHLGLECDIDVNNRHCDEEGDTNKAAHDLPVGPRQTVLLDVAPLGEEVPPRRSGGGTLYF